MSQMPVERNVVASAVEAQASPIRVLLCLYRDDAREGGALRVGEVLANHGSAAGIAAELVFAYGGPEVVATSARVPCHFLAARGPEDLRAWRRFRRLVREKRPDVVHFIDAVVWMNAALLGCGVPRLLHAHGKLIPRYLRFRDRAVLRFLSFCVDGYVGISDATGQVLVELGLADRRRTFTVYNAIEVERFARNLPPRSAARQQLGLPLDAPLLGMACRIVKYRGCQDAVRLLRRLPPEWHLLLAGDGPFLPELRRLVTGEGVSGRVHFLGNMADVRAVYAAIDGFLFLARYDSFGLATCEAMAAGVPVFGLAGDGEYRDPKYPLLKPDNCVLFDRANPQDYETDTEPASLDKLAAAIADLQAHPETYRPMVLRAQGWVRQRFDAPVQVTALRRVYEQFLAACGRRPEREASA